MKRLLRIFALLMAASMLIWIAGCGDDDEEEEDAGPAPTVSSVSVSEGQEIPANASITVTFSKSVDTATITVTGAAGAVTGIPGTTAIWTPSADMSAGAHTLTISAEDSAGQALDPAATPINFTVGAKDDVAPKIDDGACSPENGADGVDPADVADITIVFDEPMADAKMDKFEPDAQTKAEFDGDKTLLVEFLGGFELSNEMEIIITLSGSDKAGNALATTEYTFTTMAKEE
jgi:hypothetical protein